MSKLSFIKPFISSADSFFSESNVSLYKHYGFELKKEECIPKTSVMHYAMVRNPKYEKDND